MPRAGKGTGVLVAAVLICGYFTTSIAAAFAAPRRNRTSELTATTEFLIESTRNAAIRISATTDVENTHPVSASPRTHNSSIKSARSGGMPMMMTTPVFPLFIVDRDFASTVVMVNVTNVPTYADVVLSGLDGREITEERVQFTPQSQQRVDIAALLQAVGSSATKGRVSIMQSTEFNGELGAQLLMTYHGSFESSYIDEDEAMPNPEGSQILRAVSDRASGSPWVAITSLSDAPQVVAVDCIAESGPTFSKSVQLLAQAVMVVQACTNGEIANGDFGEAFSRESEDQQESRAVGISLTTNGMPGSFAAFGLAPHSDDRKEYFSALEFSDPKTILSSTTVFTGVPVGFSTVLPAGTYTPQLTFTNFSAKAVRVDVKYASTSEDTPVTRDIATVTVPPKRTKMLALGELRGDIGMQNSFLVTSNGAPGDLVSKLVSRSDSEVSEVELLGKDEKDTTNSGEHPWSLEEGEESTLLLFNHSAVAESFDVIVAGSGAVWQKLYRLQPMQTASIQLQNLIQNQVKDDTGKTFPKGIRSGVVNWFTSGPGVGKGRLLVSNAQLAMARSFSCTAYTVVCGGAPAVQITQTVPVGQNDVDLAVATQNLCNAGTLTPPHCSGSLLSGFDGNVTYSWVSTNTSILTVTAATIHSQTVAVDGVGVGQTSVVATLEDQYHCTETSGTSATGVPNITSISPSRGLIGTTVTQVTISGKGFTNGNVNVPAGIQVAKYDSQSDTQIVVDLTLATNGTLGNNQITVTASQQTSKAVNFFIQTPTSLSIVSGSASGAEGLCTSNACGTIIMFQYQVMDQDSPAQPIKASMSMWDSFGSFSPDGLNMQGVQLNTTCTFDNKTNSGPCGVSTQPDGTFKEGALGACSTVCYVNGACTTGGPSDVPQTWHISSASIVQQISEYCQKVLVNGAQPQ